MNPTELTIFFVLSCFLCSVTAYLLGRAHEAREWHAWHERKREGKVWENVE